MGMADWSKIAIGSMTALAAVGVVVAVSQDGKGEGEGSAHVKIACRDWVTASLKSPSSADFSGESVTYVGSTYVVLGSVDSENGFGAMIRNTYRCEATYDGESSRLVKLTGLAD